MNRIALISSHPIQYNAPFFALLSQQKFIELMVFYTWGENSKSLKFDPDFGKNIEWDIPLLEGYNYTFVNNTSKNPGSHHFNGIINPLLNRQIELWNPDVVWVWGWSFNSHLKAIFHFKGKVPVWFRGDSTLLDERLGFSLKKSTRRFFLKWVYSNVDKAFYVGTNNKNYYLKHGLKVENLIYAPHSIDNNRFIDSINELNQLAQELRKSLGFRDTDFVILFAGKLEKKKNPHFLLKLADEFDSLNFKFLIVGNGNLEYDLKQKTKDDKRFVFMNFQNQSQMPLVYRVSNLFILPSLGPGETWGLAINEALACAIPVAASKHCGGAKDLINPKNGFIFDPKEVANTFFKKLHIFRHSSKVDFHEEFLQTFNYNRIVESVIQELF